MKNIILVGIVVVIVAGALAYRVFSPGSQNQVQSSVSSLDARTHVLDVRTVEEFNAAHVSSADLLPVSDIQAGKMPEVAKDTPIALYCRTGKRASQAEELLKQAGFTNVRNLGGLSDLPKYGLKAS